MPIPWTRLVQIGTGAIESFLLAELPPFIAVSHTWGDALFPSQLSFSLHIGSKAIRRLQAERYPHIAHCWIDTICIDQDDSDDKKRQVPQMGHTYGQAEVVAIVFRTAIGLTQAFIDETTQNVEGALSMFREETWKEDGKKWEHGQRRRSLKQAMDMLNHFTRSPWSTRVWTLQEFVLARKIVWIGEELVPVSVEEEMFVAMPDICETLNITECVMGPYTVLYQFYGGMAGVRMGTTDRTRVMELLGNRTATLPVDEVYGTMAASGVIVENMNVEHKEEAWRLWWEQAMREGHIRWALLPPTSPDPREARGPYEDGPNCVVPPFSTRHLASSSSGLDSVKPLGPVSIKDGTITLGGRWAGICKITRRLGRVHEDADGLLHRDITLILFAANKWTQSLRIARAFGGGRYSAKKVLIVAQLLKHNYFRARLAVESGTEESFRPSLRNEYYQYVWSDFMLLQSVQMMVMNECVAHLAEMHNDVWSADIVIAMASDMKPEGQLVVLDFGAKTTSDKTVFVVVEIPPLSDEVAIADDKLPLVMHKVGVTVANEMTDLATACKYSAITLGDSNIYSFSLGGKHCMLCKCNGQAREGQSSVVAPIQPVKRARLNKHRRLALRSGLRIEKKRLSGAPRVRAKRRRMLARR